MIEKKPFIHLFRTIYGYYFFDVNKNSIIRINEDIYNYLSRVQNNDDLSINNDDLRLKEQIDLLKRSGYLSDKRITVMKHPEEETIEYILQYRLSQINLQVTQQCNLRCRYCIYSTPENPLQRSHSSKRMTFATAKKAIDFLIYNSRDARELNISFYGGEPLLEFELIKKCIEYTNESVEGKKVRFNMTTNGTIINREILEFFEKNNVHLLISLDGPEKVHNKNRRFAKNGEGSFDRVIRNLELIRNEFPKYFKENISFNSVIDPEVDYSDITDFFSNCFIVKEKDVRGSTMSSRYTYEKYETNEEYLKKSRYELFKILLWKLNRIDYSYIPKISMDQYYMNIERIIDNLNDPDCFIAETDIHSGPCIPGMNRLFVTVDGDLLPCERVSETSSIMKIGHIDTGFDFSKIKQLLNFCKLIEDECKNCWAVKYCTLCLANAEDGNRLSAKRKASYCRWVRETVEDGFKAYVVLNQFGCNVNNIKYIWS